MTTAQKRKLSKWESNFLRTYKTAIEKSTSNDNDDIKAVIMELRISIESLLRGICSLKYNFPENQNLMDVYKYLRDNSFWGAGYNDKLSIILKSCRSISDIGNWVKHHTYSATYVEAMHCLHCMHLVIEWYFKEIVDHKEVDLTTEEMQALNTVLNQAQPIPREVEALLKMKDKQIADLNANILELKNTVAKIHKKNNSSELVKNKIATSENDKISVREEIGQLQKVMKNFSDSSLYNRCGLLMLNLAILEENDENTLKEARKMFIKAIDLNHYNYEAYNNWGNLLNKEAEILENSEIQYREAIEKYEQAIKINENYFYAYYNCGSVYQKLDALKAETDPDLLKKALANYLIGEKLADEKSKNYHAYNIACIYAIDNQVDNAIAYLNRAISSGMYSYKKVKKDQDFTNLKKTPEFIAILKSLQSYH